MLREERPFMSFLEIYECAAPSRRDETNVS